MKKTAYLRPHLFTLTKTNTRTRTLADSLALSLAHFTYKLLQFLNFPAPYEVRGLFDSLARAHQESADGIPNFEVQDDCIIDLRQTLSCKMMA